MSKTLDKSKTWGKHLIIDAYGIEEKKLKDGKTIRKLLNDLPEKFKMRILGKVVIEKVASEHYPDWGLSGFVMLYESHISFHTWPKEGYVAMDLYSCKDFDDESINKYLKEFWKAKKMNVKLVIRG
ncbi:adenosylmethionine decarboxylase [Patescibacteria group bacterium]|nr:adenosylmethionine decarboxylase [Patescibacteria group bacterium]MBU0879241.1 adenosylmethionine decarboxylase [Patescibacteria group bacterium]MBU0879914.1 adenosylmethionine decarboxylase [Patescibacteria group bacterium]MBU0898109.1 adenosylmethionine decarboxylase [Patescibacteria group bacterium]MBU1062999.1 adenosylmethionine decarboxylase [Patescibacteria group bacterium]